MIHETLRAILFGSLPVALATFLLLQWSIASGRMDKFTAGDDLREQYKSRSKAAKKVKKEVKKNREKSKKPLVHRRLAGDLLHNKVITFGGGFYGTMALITYLLIETLEVWQFVTGLMTPETWLNKLGLELLIQFLINSFTNMISAFLWFATLPDYIDMNESLLWLAAAYAGYLGGLRLTRDRGEVIWERLDAWFARRGGE